MAVTALAVAAVVALAGCSAADGATGPKPAGPDAPSASGTGSQKAGQEKGSAVLDRDAVDGDLRNALTKAGLDPANGLSTSARNGVKRPDMVDWFAVVKSAEAEQALPKMGAELERAGWKPARVEGNILTYRKSGWSMLASSLPGGTEMPNVPEGSSVVQLMAHQLDGDAG
ncbi:hypothetical protein ABZ128_12945 [Streptomyces sp. NPDC006326]|uniref:hypothetical protein n=1 Tax=Streptomyces sp. NPDC006326 TaxID=3156752 RepID=UPI0033AF3C75